jgi:mycothiol synthase
MTAPSGFAVRDAVRDDVEVVAAIVNAEEEAVRGTSQFTSDDLADFWRLADFDGGSMIVERGRSPVAFAACIYREGRGECWASVHPTWRGHGLGSFLLARAETESGQRGLNQLRAGMFAENDAARRLFAGLGFREARHYFQMRIDLDGEPAQPKWPAGIVPTTFRPEDARDFHRALNEAFADEWGWHAAPFEEWRQYRLEDPDTDTSLWFTARDDEEVAAVARCDPNRDGGGWVGAIGVLKPWRRRGLGLALLHHAFAEFRRRGVPHVGLGVDADNPTGATRLYERAGMRVTKEDVIYEKDLT